jgi:peptide/nickel transport system substrate-binding protein
MPSGVSRVCAILMLAAGLLTEPGAGIAADYQETPYFAADVAAGHLPPIAQRLPEHPLVIDVKAEGKQPGRQGGVLRMLIGQTGDARAMLPFAYSRLVVYDEQYRLVPDILEGFEVAEGRIFTFHLRKGQRWSDGSAFTSEDFRYYWEDVAGNPKLTPDGLPSPLLVNGKPPKFEVIDETTMRYSWDRPNQAFLPALAAAVPLTVYRPAHYLKRFNPKYAGAKTLEHLLAEAKLDDWTDLHHQKDDPFGLTNPEEPTLGPWVSLSRPGSEVYVALRNPFYHRVDANGRQLPYIDRLVLIPEIKADIPAAVAEGKSDLQATGLGLGDLPQLQEAAKKGTIKLSLWPSGRGSELALYPNLNAADPVWRAVLRNVQFRRALSLAIDRRAINEQVYGGRGKPRANTLLPDSPLFDPDAQTAWAEFDLARAQELMDATGLKLDKNYGLRRLPDGRLVSLLVATQGASPAELQILRMIQETWRKLGVELMIGAPLPSAFYDRALSGQTLMSIAEGLADGLATPAMDPAELAPTDDQQLQWPQWGLFQQSGGTKGQPVDLPAAADLVKQWRSWRDATKDSQKTSAWRQMVKLAADQVFSIGIVGEVPQPITSSPRLHNLPGRDFYNWEPGAYFGIYQPDVFWLDEK